MSQLRLDPLTGRWTVISTQRAVRPSAFLSRVQQIEGEPSRPCPFCPGHESADLETLDSLSLPDHGGNGSHHQGTSEENSKAPSEWAVKVVNNRYPAFDGHDPMVVTHLGPVFTQASASGMHEVLLLSPDHDVSWADLTPAHSALVMQALRDRMLDHSKVPGLRHSQALVNYGREAGASIVHPHGQLLSIPFVPGEMANELAGFNRFQGNCLLCAVIEAEESVKHRVVSLDDEVAVICPFWSGNPYEMLVIPRSHEAHLYQAYPSDLDAVGRAIGGALASLRERVGDIPYNVFFHSAPFRVGSDYHWHAHILPKATTRGGFELGSGVLINVVDPEDAAAELRHLTSVAS